MTEECVFCCRNVLEQTERHPRAPPASTRGRKNSPEHSLAPLQGINASDIFPPFSSGSGLRRLFELGVCLLLNTQFE